MIKIRKTQTLFVSDGLPSNYITSIESDENNNLWISTKNGISFYDQSSLTFSNYGFDDGIFLILTFIARAPAQASDGFIFIWWPRRIDCYKP